MRNMDSARVILIYWAICLVGLDLNFQERVPLSDAFANDSPYGFFPDHHTQQNQSHSRICKTREISSGAD